MAEIGLKEMRNSVCLSEFDVTATQPYSKTSGIQKLNWRLSLFLTGLRFSIILYAMLV
jgi:hypothetical protein